MKVIAFVVCCACLFACQPEIDPDILNTPTTPAQYSLPGAPGSCSNTIVGGTYVKAVAMTPGNTVTIDVIVTVTGSWSVKTDTVNNVWFAGSGTFSSTGTKQLVLKGSGTPLADGQFDYKIMADGNICNFQLTVAATGSGNIAPVANAGQDVTIALPTNSTTLTGSATDADGTIASYSWTRIDGPASFTIASPQSAQTLVNNLVQGTYKFELTATDNLGATDKDTVVVTVQGTVVSGSLNMQQFLFAVIFPVNDVMSYDANNQIIGINSNHYPSRKIYYDNSRIHKIEYYYDDGSGNSTILGQTQEFSYDANGNVIKIMETDHSNPVRTYVYAEYTYNADNTLSNRKLYFFGTAQADVTDYLYIGGNLTGIVAYGDTTEVKYDTRTNNFKNICPQAYFLDVQTNFDQNYRSEIFYFSKNYPVEMDGAPVSVSVNAAQKPFEIRFDGVLWYRYIYN
jgi:hypothetical protein